MYTDVSQTSHITDSCQTLHMEAHTGTLVGCADVSFSFCGYTLNLLLVYIWILNYLDIDGKYISIYALERTRCGRVQRSSPLRCPERVLWNMVSRRGMPAAETIGADTIDVGLLSDLIPAGGFMMFHDTLWWTNIAIENGHRNSGFSH